MRRIALTVASTVLLAATLACRAAPPVATAASGLLFIGTYTGPQSRGIHAARFDDTTGALTIVGLAAETPNPSFLEASRDGRFVFAVNETGSYLGQQSGSVTSFAVEYGRGGLSLLKPLSVQPTQGADPCHLALDRTGRYLAVANYSGGSYAVFPVGTDGRLAPATDLLTNAGAGPNEERQQGPHGHQVVFDAANRFLLAVDLGIDRVLVYAFDAKTGRATPHVPPSAAATPGAGPRHLAFHPTGRFAFVINELNSTIATLAWSAQAGTLTPVASISTLPTPAPAGNSTAEIAVHPTGRFVYGSNRGHDSLAVFRVAADGRLSLVEHEATRGRTPRNFAIDPTGRWLLAANQGSNTIAVFRIDQQTGALEAVGPLASVGAPVSLLFMP